MTIQCCQTRESSVCLCRKPHCLYDTFFDLVNLIRPFWEMFRERHDNIVIHASVMGNYMLHARGSETLQTFTFRLLKGKQRTSVPFRTDSNIPISLHVFAFLLFVGQDLYSFTMLPSSSCMCVLLHKYWTLLYVTWRIFHSDTFPQFILSPCFCYIIHKIAIRFCHWSSQATPGTPASTYIYIYTHTHTHLI
jgi:hypothetical protein